MNEPLAHYYFVPAVREGLASYIAEPATGDRALIKANLKPLVDGVADAVKAMCVGLYGPGDVVGFNPSIVTRTDPRADFVSDFEPNYMPMIEFGGEPDFLWRFTPSVWRKGEQLQPWITLIVLTVNEFKGLGERLPDVEQKGALPVRWIQEVDLSALPDLSSARLWGHVQVTAASQAAGSDLKDFLTPIVSAEPGSGRGHVAARLLCPRRLAPRTQYTAFVVPTFKIGQVAAGLIDGLAESENALTPGWVKDAAGTIDLPYLHKWDFATGVRGDFEYLVRLLEPRQLKDLGRRRMDCSNLPYGLPPCPGGSVADKGVLEVEGALMSPELDPAKWINETPEIEAFREHLAALLNLSAANVAAGNRAGSHSERPVVTPPIFGRRHSGQQTVSADDANPWLNDVNLDPRQRAAAGLGALIVEKQQEALMASVWDQLGDIERANEVLRHGQLGLEASKGVFRRLETLSMPDLLWTAAPVFKRIRAQLPGPQAATTVDDYLGNSPIPRAAFDPAFRRVLRRRGGIRKRQGAIAPPATDRDMLSRLNSGEIAAAGPPPSLVGMPSLCDITQAAIITLEKASEPDRRARNVFRIDGRVINKATRRGITGLRLEAWDKDLLLKNDLLGDATTADRGAFRIEFGGTKFREWFVDRLPDVFFKVYRGTQQLKVTAPSVLRNVHVGDTEVVVEVDLGSVTERVPSFRLSGQVIDQMTRKGVAWLTVEAWDKDLLLLNDLVGSATTNEHGKFDIQFDESYFVEWTLDRQPDLYFKIYHGGRLIKSTETAVIRNVKPGESSYVVEIDAPSPPPLPPGPQGGGDFCETAITCEALFKVTEEAGSNLQLHQETARAICEALQGWLSPEQVPAAEPAEPVDLHAVHRVVKAAIAPWVTIPARIASRLQFGAGVHQRGVLGRLESEIDFPFPMYEPLAEISQDLILPGVETVPQNTISIVKTNRRFMESYLLGLNDSLAGEILWRGAPVYLWTSFFRQFWDVSGLNDETFDPERAKDITRLTTWARASVLGEHAPHQMEDAEQAVLLVRGDVLKRWPNTLVYAVEALADGRPALDEFSSDHEADRLWPIFSGSLPPDLTFLGFPISPAKLCKGGANGKGYFIVLEERLGEPRFGFDLLANETDPLPPLPQTRWWYDVTWSHFSAAENSYIGASPPSGADSRTPRWGESSATTANICLQRPVRISIHASKMLPKSVGC